MGISFIRSIVFSIIILFAPTLSMAVSLEETVVRVLRDIRSITSIDEFEYGGFVVWRGGRFLTPGPIQTSGLEDRVDIEVRAYGLPADKLAALFHTHPCQPDTHYTHLFSIQDVYTATRLKVPEFFLDACTGLVHKFDPMVDTEADPGEDVVIQLDGQQKKVHLVSGRIVGNVGF